MVAKAIDREAKRKGYRRNAIRVQRKIQVQFKKESDWFFLSRSGETEDISASGLCLVSDEPLEPGDRLDLKIDLPGGESPINVSGNICWVNRNSDRTRAGIKFNELEDGDQKRIRQYVITTASDSQIQQLRPDGNSLLSTSP